MTNITTVPSDKLKEMQATIEQQAAALREARSEAYEKAYNAADKAYATEDVLLAIRNLKEQS